MIVQLGAYWEFNKHLRNWSQEARMLSETWRHVVVRLSLKRGWGTNAAPQ